VAISSQALRPGRAGAWLVQRSPRGLDADERFALALLERVVEE